jgi:hypothetical protein
MKKKLLVSLIILTALVISGIVAHAKLTETTGIQEVGTGVLIDAYALTDGGSLTISLYRNGNDFHIAANLVGPDGSCIGHQAQLLHHRNTPPQTMMTEVCNGTLHVWTGWDGGTIYHWYWDLPLPEEVKVLFPMVCKDTDERK